VDAAETDDLADVDSVTNGNDTNETALLYFARVSNHFLHLVQHTTSFKTSL
jgi:hypothetical protein